MIPTSPTSQALAPDGEWMRYVGEGRPPITERPFAETKDLFAGWMVIDVDTYGRAGELSSAPAAGGEASAIALTLHARLPEPRQIAEACRGAHPAPRHYLERLPTRQ